MSLATARYDLLRDEARRTQLHSAASAVLVHALLRIRRGGGPWPTAGLAVPRHGGSRARER